jgi:hypothetical protein
LAAWRRVRQTLHMRSRRAQAQTSELGGLGARACASRKHAAH